MHRHLLPALLLAAVPAAARADWTNALKPAGPPGPELTLVADAPPLALRDPFYHCAFDADWSVRNRTNAPDAPVPEAAGGHVDYGGLFVHTHATLLPPDKYFKDHPEYFAQNAAGQRYPAQLCPT